MNDAELLELAAIALRYGYSVRDLHELPEENRQAHIDRIAELSKTVHDAILDNHPEIADKLPRGGITALIHG